MSDVVASHDTQVVLTTIRMGAFRIGSRSILQDATEGRAIVRRARRVRSCAPSLALTHHTAGDHLNPPDVSDEGRALTQLATLSLATTWPLETSS